MSTRSFEIAGTPVTGWSLSSPVSNAPQVVRLTLPALDVEALFHINSMGEKSGKAVIGPSNEPEGPNSSFIKPEELSRSLPPHESDDESDVQNHPPSPTPSPTEPDSPEENPITEPDSAEELIAPTNADALKGIVAEGGKQIKRHTLKMKPAKGRSSSAATTWFQTTTRGSIQGPPVLHEDCRPLVGDVFVNQIGKGTCIQLWVLTASNSAAGTCRWKYVPFPHQHAHPHFSSLVLSWISDHPTWVVYDTARRHTLPEIYQL